MGISEKDYPSDDQIKHDVETITTALEGMHKPENHWHSIGFQMTIDGIAQMITLELLQIFAHSNNPIDQAADLIVMHCEHMFVLGHTVGEGATHIVKSPCDNIARMKAQEN